MTQNARSFTLDEIIRVALERRLADVRVALPAAVINYSAARQTATMRPLLTGVSPDPTGVDRSVTLPDIYNVPVLFAGGGGARATFPVAAGDQALLVFSDRALDRWKSLGAGSPPAALDPKANNQHSLADAFAIVGLQAPGLPWLSAPTDRATFGYDAGKVIEVTLNGINLGAGSTDAAMLGTTYRNAEHAAFTTLQSQLTALAAALTTAAGTSTPLLLPPAAAAHAAALTAAAAAATAASSALATLEAGAATYLSATVKVGV